MNIVHVLRAPVGGVFRHVLDLALGQVARGHRVGVICDSRTGNQLTEEALAAIAPKLALGLLRIPMWRQPTPLDLLAVRRVGAHLHAAGADVVHGHGAKGGAFARLAAAPKGILRAYTPHGGSLHDAVGGRLHLLLEKLLMQRARLYLFESAYSHAAYLRKVGSPRGIARVVHNGVAAAEFEPVELSGDASDVVFL